MNPTGRSVHFISHHDGENAVSRYRCFNFIGQLESQGWKAKFSYLYQPGPILIEEDVVVLTRVLLDDRIRDLVERLKASGKAVVFGVDDLVFSGEWADKERAEQEDPRAEAVWKQTMTFVAQSKGTLMLCDCSLASTQYLAKRSLGLGKEAFVLRNTLPSELWQLSRRVVKSDYYETPIDLQSTQESGSSFKTEGLAAKVVVGYSSGTRTHNRDFDSVSVALAQVLATHGNVELLIVGPVKIPSVLASFEDRISRHDTVDWRDLPPVLATFDVNLAPLDLGFVFNHGKSHLKWLEAAAVGVPTVASRTDELTSSIEEALNGFTAVTEENWVEALEKLILDGDLRKRVGQSALQKVGREYLASAQVAKTCTIFESIAAKFSSAASNCVLFEGYEEPSLFAKGIRKARSAMRKIGF